MRILQIHESTVVGENVERAGIHFMVIPRRAFASPETLDQLDAMTTMKALKISPHCTIAADRLPYGLTAVMEIRGPDDVRIGNLNDLAQSHPVLFDFSRYVAAQTAIPFESSPLGGTTLSELVNSGSAPVIGAGLGFAVAGSVSPLLFVTVPAGIVICCAAKGIGLGIEEGLRRIISEQIIFRLGKKVDREDPGEERYETS